MKIPFTKFIQRLCDNKSARIANATVKATGGAFVPNTYFLEQELAKVETLNFRAVEHRQTNAIRFKEAHGSCSTAPNIPLASAILSTSVKPNTCLW